MQVQITATLPQPLLTPGIMIIRFVQQKKTCTGCAGGGWLTDLRRGGQPAVGDYSRYPV
jgi:hypothetical protein